MFKRTKAPAPSSPARERAPMWEELVKPGPKGDPKKRAKRLAASRVGTPSIEPQHQPKRSTGRTYSAGMTTLHNTRVRPVHNDLPRPDVMRRRLIRGLRAQGVTVIEAPADEQAVA